MVSDERLGRMLRTSLPDFDWEVIERSVADPSGDTPWSSFLAGILLGIVVGVVVAMALAPGEGRQTRAQARGLLGQLRSNAGRSSAEPDETLINAAEQAEADLFRRIGPAPT